MRALIAGAFGALVAAAAFTVACAPRAGRIGSGTPAPVMKGPITGEAHGRLDGRDRMARIALAGKARQAPVSATGRWRIDEQGGRTKLVTGQGAEQWRVE